MLSGNQVALAYLVASVFFILALKGLSSPLTSRRGNLFGMIGMAIAVVVTLTLTRNWSSSSVASRSVAPSVRWSRAKCR